MIMRCARLLMYDIDWHTLFRWNHFDSNNVVSKETTTMYLYATDLQLHNVPDDPDLKRSTTTLIIFAIRVENYWQQVNTPKSVMHRATHGCDRNTALSHANVRSKQMVWFWGKSPAHMNGLQQIPTRPICDFPVSWASSKQQFTCINCESQSIAEIQYTCSQEPLETL
jgi:hypothetical protein